MTKTDDITRGAQRLLGDMGFDSVTEMTLPNGRRVDLIGLDKKGSIFIVEVKSSLEDFRSDQKWSDYLDFCDLFAFAVDEDFPRDVLPDDHGLIIADRYEAAMVRDSQVFKLAPARRKSMTLKFARVAARRLHQETL